MLLLSYLIILIILRFFTAPLQYYSRVNLLYKGLL